MYKTISIEPTSQTFSSHSGLFIFEELWKRRAAAAAQRLSCQQYRIMFGLEIGLSRVPLVASGALTIVPVPVHLTAQGLGKSSSHGLAVSRTGNPIHDFALRQARLRDTTALAKSLAKNRLITSHADRLVERGPRSISTNLPH